VSFVRCGRAGRKAKATKKTGTHSKQLLEKERVPLKGPVVGAIKGQA